MIINGKWWKIRYVPSDSVFLHRSDGSLTVGMTDGNTNTIFLNENLQGDFHEKVLTHEICHAICFSYEIYMPIEQEEMLCNFVAEHGREVLYLVDMILFNQKCA